MHDRRICRAARLRRHAVETLEARLVLAVIPVTTTADIVANDAAISLREAVALANLNPADDVIVLQAGQTSPRRATTTSRRATSTSHRRPAT
jgi:hypothetical protein